MLRTIAMKSGSLGLLLMGVVVGVAGAQVAETFQRVGSASTGLFTLTTGEEVKFNVSLDGHGPGTSKVQMRLIDPNGTVKASKLVLLAPGRSATLPYNVPGRYRAQAELFDSSLVTDERVVASTVEVSNINDAVTQKFVCPAHIWPDRE